MAIRLNEIKRQDKTRDFTWVSEQYAAGKLNIGDEVVSTKHGWVIRASFIEKIIKRDRILGRVDEVVDGENCKIKVY